MVNKRKVNAKKLKKQKKLPFVSVCTPTFNRRPFFPYAIKNFLNQDYPKDRIEWIIIDDGTDPVRDLVEDIPNTKYYHYSEKMSLGKKRNLMHEKSQGSIIVYMDDDDFYPTDRVSHAVDKLMKNPNALCAGSSQIYIWFRHNQQMYSFGPYGPNHATAGTFAFKRELLKQTSYEDGAALAEEKHFLKNYTIPFVQLDPLKTILVFSHDHNTFDKRELLKNPNPKFVKESSLKVHNFIKDAESKDFYMNKVNDLLADYEPGHPKNKPDVIQQTKEIRERRNKMAQENSGNSKIVLTDDNGNKKEISIQQLVDITQGQQKQLAQQNQQLSTLQSNQTILSSKNNELEEEIKKLREENEKLKKQLEENKPAEETIVFNLS